MNPTYSDARPPDARAFWHYACPECHQPTHVRWDKIEMMTRCIECGFEHYPPTPHEDHYAWIDSQDWPPEMRETVVSMRGTICTVPGCYREATTLAHRVPYLKDGRTCVDNLVPICAEHAADRGDQDWDEWLASIRQQTTDAQPTMEITITARRNEPEPLESVYAVPAGFAQPVAAMTATEARALPPPRKGEPTLLLARPFARAAATRLELDYDWEATTSGRCRLFVIAWPRGERPDISLVGGPRYTGGYGVKEHLAVAGERGNAAIEMPLPPGGQKRWTAAIVLVDEGATLRLGDFVLAAAT
jgi:hypothetical protein